MSGEELLDVKPPVLSFKFELHKRASCSIRLLNKTQKYVAFKVKTTAPDKYCVQPNVGIVPPRSTLDVTVTMQAPKAHPPNMQSKDKFLIQNVVASLGTTIEDVKRLFNVEGLLIQKCKLEVVYTFPPEVQSSVPKTRTGKLLNVKPSELQFPFELNKELSCSFQLSNMTENHVAFKVKTTNVKKYCVIPNDGFVLPLSTCDITVKMQAQDKVPPDVKCNDKFLIQSVTANSAATRKDINSDMFNEAEECKLTVGYIFRRHTSSPKSVTSEEGSPWNLRNMEESNLHAPQVVPAHDRNGNDSRDIILGLMIIGLFIAIICFLVKMAMPLIGSGLIFMMVLATKMVNKMVVDSVEDWVVKALCYVFIHLLFGRRNGNQHES